MIDFVELVKANGVLGLVTGLVVLVAVFALSKSGVVVTGDQKRFANVILSVLLAGLSLVNPEDPQVVVAAIASVASALLYELIKWVGQRVRL